MRDFKFQTRAVIAALLLITVSTSAISRDNNKPRAVREDILQFDVDDEINTFQIDSYNGNINLLKGNDSSRIHGTAETWAYGESEEQAHKRLSKNAWEFSKSGKTLILLLKGRDGGSDINTLSVPAMWNIDVGTSNGKINISDGFRIIQAGSSNGTINIEGGIQVEAGTSNGLIKYAGSAKDFNLQSSNGKIDIQLHGDWNGNGKAESSNGNIFVTCSGIIDATLRSSSRNGQSLIYGPKLSEKSGKGSLSLTTGNGNISITHPLNTKIY